MHSRIDSLTGNFTAPAILTLAAFVTIQLAETCCGESPSDQSLIHAIRNQDKALIKKLLEPRVDVNATRPDGSTALHWAVYKDDLKSVVMLIRAGARLDVRNELGITPLHLACTNASSSMVEQLLEAGADPNAALPSGESPIMTAARTGDKSSVVALIARGANVNAAESSRRQTALMWALAENHTDVARTLIESGADVDAATTGGFTPLLFTAREGNVTAAVMLLDAGVDVNTKANDGNSALHVAVLRGHSKLAMTLLDHGADPNADGPGFTPLHWAVGTWETEITGRNGIVTPPDHPWSTMTGVQEGKQELVAALLDHGADPNARLTKNPRRYGFTAGSNRPKGSTSFALAALAGDPTLMRMLLKHGADANLAADNGVTPLMQACGVRRSLAECKIPISDSVEAVRLMLENDVDVKAADNLGDTALHGAARIKSAEIVQLLVDAGAEINVVNKRGQTPLFTAEHYWPIGIALTYKRSDAGDLLRKLSLPESVSAAIAEWGTLSAEVRKEVETLLQEELQSIEGEFERRKQDPVGPLIKKTND